jgi:nucleoside-diphosphate-sugar epimerase
MTGNKVFVTGGSGFLGSALIPLLISRGHAVRALARSQRAQAIVAGLGAEPVAGALADVETVTAAMRGCGSVVHAAARSGQSGSVADFRRDNVAGTENVLSAARAAGASRFVLVGAAMCLLGSKPIQDADESWPLKEPRYSPYARTKTLADRAVRGANVDGFATCVVRPGWVWGPGDPQSAAIVAAARSGRMRLIDGGRYPIVTTHVDNAAHAIELALRRGRGGQAYYAFDDGSVQIRDFVTALLATQNLDAPTRSVPRGVALVMGSLLDAGWALFRRTDVPPLSRLLVELNGGPFLVSDKKARTELGYEPIVSRDEALRRLAVGS